MPEIDNEILRPKVQIEIDEAIKEISRENMSAFLLRTSVMTSIVDHHIIKNCVLGNIETMVDCIKKANNIKANALNKLGEKLVEKCGGKMTYIKEE